jgi:hypothetical protein
VGSHRMESDHGDFEVIVEDGRIVDVVGDWPETGIEFELRGEIPEHSPPQNPPESIKAAAAERAMDGCYWSESGCHVCFCDGSGKILRCVRMC